MADQDGEVMAAATAPSAAGPARRGRRRRNAANPFAILSRHLGGVPKGKLERILSKLHVDKFDPVHLAQLVRQPAAADDPPLIVNLRSATHTHLRRAERQRQRQRVDDDLYDSIVERFTPLIESYAPLPPLNDVETLVLADVKVRLYKAYAWELEDDLAAIPPTQWPWLYALGLVDAAHQPGTGQRQGNQ